MKEEDMIERVAKAIYAEFENRPKYARAQMNGVIATECARAAIEALREPTPEMVRAAQEAYYSSIIDQKSYTGDMRAAIKAALNAIIDAALKSPSGV